VYFSLGLLLTCQARATFHTWKVNEIYYSADGFVQFIELRESLGFTGENLLATHFIRCIRGSVTNTFIFPTNLPSTLTANKTFVIATANLSAVPRRVRPDYVFTNAVPFLSPATAPWNLPVLTRSRTLVCPRTAWRPRSGRVA
jgi:hypothetical protein